MCFHRILTRKEVTGKVFYLQNLLEMKIRKGKAVKGIFIAGMVDRSMIKIHKK